MLGVTEFACGILVGIGLIARLATLPLLATLAIAITRFKWRSGFIAGWDWPLSVFGIALGVLILGAGQFSLDGALHWGV